MPRPDPGPVSASETPMFTSASAALETPSASAAARMDLLRVIACLLVGREVESQAQRLDVLGDRARTDANALAHRGLAWMMKGSAVRPSYNASTSAARC